jgi:hypothetical protein
MSQRRRTPSEWDEVFREFTTSGLSAVSFCKERGLNAGYFGKRHRQWRQGRSTSFVRAQVRKVSPSVGITLELPDLTLRCSADTPPGWVADLVTRLRR